MPREGLVDIDIEMGEMESDADPTLLSFQASAIIAVCAAVLIGNAFICALNCFKSHAHAIFLKFVLISAGINLIAALICMPLMAACLIQAEWRFGLLLCKMTGGVCFGSMILTMFFCILSSVSKLLLYTNAHFPKKRCDIFFEKDFVIIFAVLMFVLSSLFILCFLVDVSKIRIDPSKTLCKYANSPNISSYRMFYIVYSILLTFADLMLVMPI
eukprot:TCONS_00059210-protein